MFATTRCGRSSSSPTWSVRRHSHRCRIPYDPFIALLNSPVWTDRNKSSLALDDLSAARDPKLLEALRRDALTSLVEMARWKSEGHATPSLRILARIAGLPEEAVKISDRERIITAAMGRQ